MKYAIEVKNKVNEENDENENKDDLKDEYNDK